MPLACNDLIEALKHSEKVPVRIWEGYNFYVLSVDMRSQTVVGKFVPCAENARKYTLPITDVKSIVEEA